MVGSGANPLPCPTMAATWNSIEKSRSTLRWLNTVTCTPLRISSRRNVGLQI
jgi:hypothetical protein